MISFTVGAPLLIQVITVKVIKLVLSEPDFKKISDKIVYETRNYLVPLQIARWIVKDLPTLKIIP